MTYTDFLSLSLMQFLEGIVPFLNARSGFQKYFLYVNSQ